MRNHLKKIIYLSVFICSFAVHAGSFDDFFRAVRSDNASGIRTLLNRGFDPNTRDAQGQTGLLIALREPSPKVIQVLLESPQTDVDAGNSKDESPLMLAAIKGEQAVVTRLLERDAAVNKPGWTPLHYAATSGQLTIMKQLLDHYAFIDAQSPNGTTPLMMAAMYGSAEAVKLLLDEGADTQMKNEQGMTALDFAQRGQRPDAVELLTAAMRGKKPPADGKW
ncbi:ankyrin repeat protein [Variovorax sp. SRS16]|uniref:ankyrin repeat domain-containing protein n=1 Tax=Variovorax sp. SRS16 TaxID=282217 RepID=UPI0013174A26|nr:ankyrin repeat domain-containing protein [Variovorax sp. SRS16]VTU20820.1 ankyrin repeat protein [Variovorax sp. SRS16]